MVDEKFAWEGESYFPSQQIRLLGSREKLTSRPNAGLIVPASKLVRRFGGEFDEFRPDLVSWSRRRLTRIGRGVVYFSALNQAVLSGEPLFEGGKLFELGQELAKQASLSTWKEHLSENYPDLEEHWDLRLIMSPIETGSLKWVQKLAPVATVLGVTVTVMAQGPTAWANMKTIYAPAVYSAIAAAHDYAIQYTSALEKILDATITPVAPRPLPSRIPVKPAPAPDRQRRLPPKTR